MSFDIPMPSPERIKADVDYLKEWISKESHLPKIKDDKWLETFLYNNKFSLEKTKFKLERYYSLRTKYPEILKNRDPTSPEILQSCDVAKIAFSNKLTKDNSRVLFVRYETDANAFDMVPYLKRVYMLLDLSLVCEENRLSNLIFIGDFQHIRYLHLLKLLSETPKATEIFNDAYTERLKGMHFINFPSFAEKAIDMIKKYFPEKIADRFHTYSSSKRTTLFEMVDEDVVCSDFGGKGPSLTELQGITMRQMTGLSLTLVIGGTETVSQLLNFTIHSLSLYPEYQRKIRRETCEAMKKHGVLEINFEVTQDLSFTFQCLYGTNCTIRKGDIIVLAPYSMARDERIFRDPHVFDPEHSNPENIKLPTGTVLNFGIGPRKCPAYKPAIVVAACFLASFLYKYEIKPRSHLKQMNAADFHQRGFVISPRRDILVDIVRCKNSNGV